jgi:O-antigen ligase
MAAWLLGFTTNLGLYLDNSFGKLRLSLSLAVMFGVLGWWRGVYHPILRSYLRWAFPFALIGLVSLAAAHPISLLSLPVKPGTNGIQAVKLLWLLLIPGIVVVMQNRRLSTALVRGLISGAVAFLLVALERAMQGLPALTGNHHEFMLHTHRNVIDTIVVSIVPIVLFAPFVRLRRSVRYAYVGGTIAWLISSHGRTGLLAMILFPLVYLMLKPSGDGKPIGARIAVAAALGFLFFNVLSNVSISWIPATSRLSEATAGTRSDSDEIRILLLKKSLILTEKHPLFGVGLGHFVGAYDPVLEQAPNDNDREQALELPAHNTYLETMASTGVLGAIFFVGTLLAPLAAAVRYSADRAVRATTASYCLTLFAITFHPLLDTFLFVAITVALIYVVQAAVRAEESRGLELAQDVSQ